MPSTHDDRAQFVFESARPHVAGWPSGLWHSEVHQPHSSQALCVSVWGTIAAHPDRAAIVKTVLVAAGLSPGAISSAKVRCEAGARHELAALLNETGGNATPTCVDALIEWPGGTIAIESKFTESSFGTCGQLRARTDIPPGDPAKRYKLGPACTGHHGPGSDLKTLTSAPRLPGSSWNFGDDPHGLTVNGNGLAGLLAVAVVVGNEEGVSLDRDHELGEVAGSR